MKLEFKLSVGTLCFGGLILLIMNDSNGLVFILFGLILLWLFYYDIKYIKGRNQ